MRDLPDRDFNKPQTGFSIQAAIIFSFLIGLPLLSVICFIKYVWGLI